MIFIQFFCQTYLHLLYEVESGKCKCSVKYVWWKNWIKIIQFFQNSFSFRPAIYSYKTTVKKNILVQIYKVEKAWKNEKNFIVTIFPRWRNLLKRHIYLLALLMKWDQMGSKSVLSIQNKLSVWPLDRCSWV